VGKITYAYRTYVIGQNNVRVASYGRTLVDNKPLIKQVPVASATQTEGDKTGQQYSACNDGNIAVNPLPVDEVAVRTLASVSQSGCVSWSHHVD